jgi:hypothetical protein
MGNPILDAETHHEVDGFIELHKMYGENAQHTLTQYIVWEWHPLFNDFCVRQWYLSHELENKTEDEIKKEFKEIKERLKMKVWPEELPNPVCLTRWTGQSTVRVERDGNKRVKLILSNSSHKERAVIYAKWFMETSSVAYDPETNNLKKLPREYRNPIVIPDLEYGIDKEIFLKKLETKFKIEE